MKNELLTIGPFTVYGYGLMIGIGIVVAYLMAEKRAKNKKLDPELIFGLVIWCLIAGAIGSKLLFAITQIRSIIEDPMFILHSLRNGWVVYGGLIGGLVGGYLYCRHKKVNFFAYADIAVPSVAIAQGFGRIGCFLAGCCYGAETQCAFSLTFHTSSYAPNGIPLVPTQPIMSVLNFVHVIILIWFAKRKKAEGQVVGLYLTLYSIGRFIMEYFRGDVERGSVGILSTSQFIAIFMLLAGIAMLVLPYLMARKNVRLFMTGEHGTALTEDAETTAADKEADSEE